MTKLARLLDKHEAAFARSLNELEKATHHSSHDVRMLGDLTVLARQTFDDLGLDAQDTNPEELHGGFMARMRALENQLQKKLQYANDIRIEKCVPFLFPEICSKKETFGIRMPIAKRLLKEQLPVRTMRHLGYKSISAMLKNEDIWEIHAAIRFMESDEWHESFNVLLSKLTKKDFALRPIHFLTMPDIWIKPARAFMSSRMQGIYAVKEIGLVASLPLPMRPGSFVTTVCFALHYSNEVSLYSNYFRRLDSHEFGKALADTIMHDQPGAIVVGGQNMHWRVAQKHFSHHAHEAQHLAQGFVWHAAEDLLCNITEAADFWKNKGSLALECQGIIFSANLLDNCLNFYHQSHFADRSLKWMRLSLETDLYSRYMHSSTVREHVARSILPVTTA